MTRVNFPRDDPPRREYLLRGGVRDCTETHKLAILHKNVQVRHAAPAESISDWFAAAAGVACA